MSSATRCASTRARAVVLRRLGALALDQQHRARAVRVGERRRRLNALCAVAQNMPSLAAVRSPEDADEEQKALIEASKAAYEKAKEEDELETRPATPATPGIPA